MLTHVIGSLSLIVWVPIFFGVAVLLVGRDGRERIARWMSLVGSILSALVVIPVWMQFDAMQSEFQFI